jgi:hypothetical protein
VSYAKIIVACIAVTSINSLAQENPFEFKPRQEVQVVQQEVQVDTTELSAPQREQVIALLTTFLSDASVNSKDSIFQIGDGKKYEVIPDEDVLIGKIAGQYIVWDESRKKNVYYSTSNIDDFISESEFAKISESQNKTMAQVGGKLLETMKGAGDSALEYAPSVPKMDANIKLGRQAKTKN